MKTLARGATDPFTFFLLTGICVLLVGMSVRPKRVSRALKETINQGINALQKSVKCIV